MKLQHPVDPPQLLWTPLPGQLQANWQLWQLSAAWILLAAEPSTRALKAGRGPLLSWSQTLPFSCWYHK